MMNKIYKIIPCLIPSLLSGCTSGFKVGDLFDFYFKLSEETIKEVSVEYGYIGTAPEYSYLKTLRSSNIEDIRYNLNILNEPIIESQSILCGGSYRLVTFYTVDELKYEVYFANHFVYCDDKCFALKNSPYKLPDIKES